MVAIIAGVYTLYQDRIIISTPHNHEEPRNEHTSSINSPSGGNAHKTHAHFYYKHFQETQNLCISFMHGMYHIYLSCKVYPM